MEAYCGVERVDVSRQTLLNCRVHADRIILQIFWHVQFSPSGVGDRYEGNAEGLALVNCLFFQASAIWARRGDDALFRDRGNLYVNHLPRTREWWMTFNGSGRARRNAVLQRLPRTTESSLKKPSKPCALAGVRYPSDTWLLFLNIPSLVMSRISYPIFAPENCHAHYPKLLVEEGFTGIVPNQKIWVFLFERRGNDGSVV